MGIGSQGKNWRGFFITIFQTKDRKGNHNLLGVALGNKKLPMRARIATWEFIAIIA